MKLTRSLPAWLLLGLLTWWTLPGLAQRPMPPGDGRDTIAAACTLCHSPAYVTRFDRTPTEWREIVTFMVGLGAPLMGDEIETVVEYLSKNFGATKPLAVQVPGAAKVNVNRASSGEIEAVLGLSTKEADAIVHYREQNGAIHEWDDLKKIPDVDLKKIDAKKDRVSF
jgi:competence protein ComEA